MPPQTLTEVKRWCIHGDMKRIVLVIVAALTTAPVFAQESCEMGGIWETRLWFHSHVKRPVVYPPDGVLGFHEGAFIWEYAVPTGIPPFTNVTIFGTYSVNAHFITFHPDPSLGIDSFVMLYDQGAGCDAGYLGYKDIQVDYGFRITRNFPRP